MSTLRHKYHSSFWFWLFSFVGLALLCYFLKPVVIPFAISFLLAYILNPGVDWLERHYIPRIVSIILILILLFLIIFLIIEFLVPSLTAQFALLAKLLPDILPNLLTWVATHLKIKLPVDLNQTKQLLLTPHLPASLSANSSWIKNIGGALLTSGKVLLEIIVDLILIPIITLYFLKDWKIIQEKLHMLMQHLPRSYRQAAIATITECSQVLASFFRGQLFVTLGLAFYYSIALAIIRIELAIVLGILIGILAIIPYFGIFIGFILTLFITLARHADWTHLLGVIIIFSIGHIIEGYIFQPWLVGNRIGLHPIVVIFSAIAGGLLFGILGVFLALPTVAIFIILFKLAYQKLALE